MAPLVPFATLTAHAYRELVPQEFTAQVLAATKYPFPGQKGGFWTEGACPYDLMLFWNPFSSSNSSKAATSLSRRDWEDFPAFQDRGG